MRLPLMLACFLALAPLVAAQGNETTNEQEQPQEPGNGWVDDCPPDMFCAYEEQPQNGTCEPGAPCEYGESGCIECSGPAPGDTDETAACTEEKPCPFGPEDCIECSGPPQGETCMDGSAQDCDPNVQYLDGGSPTTTSDDQAPLESKTVPAVAAVGVLGTLGLAVLLVRRAVR